MKRGKHIFTSIAVVIGLASPVAVATSAWAVPLPESDLVVVSATSPLDSTHLKYAEASCPFGTKVIGGGGDVNGGVGVVGVARSVNLTGFAPGPSDHPNTVYAAAQEEPSYAGTWSLTAYVICASGLAGYEVVRVESRAGAIDRVASATATCPAGKKVIGALGSSNVKLSYFFNHLSVSPDLTSVHAETVENENAFLPNIPVAIAYAFCVNPIPGHQRVAASSPVTSANKTVTVACPDGTRLYGTGGVISGSASEVYLEALKPVGTASVFVDAREDATGYSGTWSVQAIGVCAV
jgi:hypothetical protein